MKRTAGTITAIVLLLVAACGGPANIPAQSAPSTAPETAPPFTVKGAIVIEDITSFDGDETYKACSTTGGYTDIAEGAEVTVTDAAGTKVGLGSLQAGTNADFACRFPFQVDDIPEGTGIYDVAIGNEARGSVTFKRADLDNFITLSF